MEIIENQVLHRSQDQIPSTDFIKFRSGKKGNILGIMTDSHPVPGEIYYLRKFEQGSDFKCLGEYQFIRTTPKGYWLFTKFEKK